MFTRSECRQVFACIPNFFILKTVNKLTLTLRNTPLVSTMHGLVTDSIRGSEMTVSHENMISLENVRHSALLRQASGYIELAAFNMAPDEGVSKPAEKLLLTAIQLLDRLSVTEKSNGNAIALRAEALRALCRFSDALSYFSKPLPTILSP